MERNRAGFNCCGSRAPGNNFANISEETARKRIKEFKETGAGRLITACPFCKENFQGVMPGGK